MEFLNSLSLFPIAGEKPDLPPLTFKSKPLPTDAAETEKCAKFFRANPVEISSPLGRMMFATILKPNEKISIRHLTYQRSQGYLRSYSKSFTVRKFKDKDCHLAKFSRRERILHSTEKAIGLNRKSWAQLNRCKECSVSVDKLPEKVVNEYKLKRLQQQIKSCKRLVVISTDIMTIPSVIKLLKQSTMTVPPVPAPKMETEAPLKIHPLQFHSVPAARGDTKIQLICDKIRDPISFQNVSKAG